MSNINATIATACQLFMNYYNKVSHVKQAPKTRGHNAAAVRLLVGNDNEKYKVRDFQKLIKTFLLDFLLNI